MCVHVQLCAILCSPMGCSPSGSSVHGIIQARILEWVAISYLRRCSWSRDWTQVSCVSLHWQSDSLPLSHLGSHKPYASLVAQRLKRLPAMRETWVQSLGREDPLEKEMATHSSILAWRSPWGCKELDTTEWLHFHFQTVIVGNQFQFPKQLMNNYVSIPSFSSCISED